MELSKRNLGMGNILMRKKPPKVLKNLSLDTDQVKKN